MEYCEHDISIESLSTAILRGKRHEGGLKMWPCLAMDPAWFSQIREEVIRLVERRTPSEVCQPTHPANWVQPTGRTTQHSLFNASGDTSDYGKDYRGESGGKFFTDADSPATAEFVSCFAERLHNFRVNTLFPGAGLKAHEESIVRDDLICLRFHMPVVTNEHASMVLDDERFHFKPGIAYFFNKGCVHSAENLSSAPRYHFVWDLWLGQWAFETMFSRDGADTPHPGLRRIESDKAAGLCASTPVEITEYRQGTASGSIILATREAGAKSFVKSAVNFDPDITPVDESISLSGTWHPLEHWAGDTFRWVSHSGTITLLAVDNGTERLDLEVEPGPGVAELPLQFEVVDEMGCQLLKASISGRQKLSVDVPVHAGAPSHVRILTRNGGRIVPGDSRILDFRVFRIDRHSEVEHLEAAAS